MPYPSIDIALPHDRAEAVLVGRAWQPAAPAGPVVVGVRGEELVELSDLSPTISQLLNRHDAAAIASGIRDAPVFGRLGDILQNSLPERRDAKKPWLLAPCDLQPVKASGVTFASSLLERLIEERAKGDPAQASEIRRKFSTALGGELSGVRPGSAAAMNLKTVLIKDGYWSQYLEVGIGPDAEIFTKCPPLAAVGFGAAIGIHPNSSWNNPEPEIVLAINARGEVVGASLGNDVNLRDVEGRSALLLGKAKDNNASCAIGPFIRLFHAGFGIEQVRQAEIGLRIEGEDGFILEGSSSMSKISRDPLDLAAQTLGPHHQYPDGVMLFLGTMFAPTKDRDRPGEGFTHKLGDLVSISTPALGSLINRVTHTDKAEPWSFGIADLMQTLARRGVLSPT